MLKRLIFIAAFVIAMLLLAAPAFASGDDSVSDVVYNKDTKTTDQFLVNITRPVGYPSTLKKTYLICGNTDKLDVKIKLLVFNEEKDCYADYSQETSTWEIDGSGIFMKEIELWKEGANRIRIVAFRSSDPGVLQINDFTITLLKEEGIKDKISNVINEVLNKILNK